MDDLSGVYPFLREGSEFHFFPVEFHGSLSRVSPRVFKLVNSFRQLAVFKARASAMPTQALCTSCGMCHNLSEMSLACHIVKSAWFPLVKLVVMFCLGIQDPDQDSEAIIPQGNQ